MSDPTPTPPTPAQLAEQGLALARGIVAHAQRNGYTNAHVVVARALLNAQRERETCAKVIDECSPDMDDDATPLPELLRSLYETASESAKAIIELGQRVERAERYAISQGASGIPCDRCGGPVYEFSVPSDLWNKVVRKGGPEGDSEYLCLHCYSTLVGEHILEAEQRAEQAERERDEARQAKERLITAAFLIIPAAFKGDTLPERLRALVTHWSETLVSLEQSESTVAAWHDVVSALEAHIMDRAAMGDEASPQTYLDILRGDVADVSLRSKQILAATQARETAERTAREQAEAALADAQERIAALNKALRDCLDLYAAYRFHVGGGFSTYVYGQDRLDAIQAALDGNGGA